MKILTISFLMCFSVAASDTGIEVTSTVSTNSETGAIYTEETFSRDGQTNLIRMTKTQAGVATGRLQRFFHDGKQVAVFSGLPESLSFTTKAGSPYNVGLDFLPSKDIRCLMIYGKDANGKNFIDGFYPTNGVYYPISNSELEIQSVK